VAEGVGAAAGVAADRGLSVSEESSELEQAGKAASRARVAIGIRARFMEVVSFR
jgi:hypothetical protein